MDSVRRQLNIPLESIDDPLAVIEHALRKFRAKHGTSVRPVLALDDVHSRYDLQTCCCIT